MYNKTLFLNAVKCSMVINHFVASTRADRISLITRTVFESPTVWGRSEYSQRPDVQRRSHIIFRSFGVPYECHTTHVLDTFDVVARHRCLSYILVHIGMCSIHPWSERSMSSLMQLMTATTTTITTTKTTATPTMKGLCIFTTTS